MSQEHGTPTHWWGSNVTVQIFINTGLVQFCDLPVNISHFLNSERIQFFKLSRDIELENFRVTDYCRGQQSHHHVNHIIMSTTSSSSSREMNSDEFRLEKALAEVGSVFPQVRASICKSSRQQVHRTVARARFALENEKNTVQSPSRLEDEVGKMCARLFSKNSNSHRNRKKLSLGAALDLRGRVRRAKCARDCSESSIWHNNI